MCSIWSHPQKKTCPLTFHFSLGWKVEKQWFLTFYWIRMRQNWKYPLRLSHLLKFSCKVLSKVIYELQFLFRFHFWLFSWSKLKYHWQDWTDFWMQKKSTKKQLAIKLRMKLMSLNQMMLLLHGIFHSIFLPFQTSIWTSKNLQQLP